MNEPERSANNVATDDERMKIESHDLAGTQADG